MARGPTVSASITMIDRSIWIEREDAKREIEVEAVLLNVHATHVGDAHGDELFVELRECGCGADDRLPKGGTILSDQSAEHREHWLARVLCEFFCDGQVTLPWDLSRRVRGGEQQRDRQRRAQEPERNLHAVQNSVAAR